MKQITLSVVVPVYNSEASLPILYQRLASVCRAGKISWELILVNDCSKDNSWTAIKTLATTHNNVAGINLMNNFGQHNALLCGLRHASGSLVVTMDDDLQHPPEEIIRLLRKQESGKFMVVYGQYRKKKHGWFRDLCSRAVNNLLATITGSGYGVTSFRLIHRDVVNRITSFTGYNVMIDVLLKDAVSPAYVGHCLVEHHQRTLGNSNYSYRKLFWYALNMIFNFTIWPLRIASIFGFIFSGIGLALAVFYLVYYLLYGISVSGWTSLFIAVTFFSGMILFVLGILGEYLGRVFMNINQKPQYVEKEVFFHA